MRRMVVALVVAGGLLAATVVTAEEQIGDGDRAQIRSIVQDQLDAFQHDDGARAFGFASPMIQGMFHDPETFMQMVKGAYQPVYRPKEVEFRELVVEQGSWAQRVMLVGPDGVPVIAHYLMQQQPDGSWKINGCLIERSSEVTT